MKLDSILDQQWITNPNQGYHHKGSQIFYILILSNYSYPRSESCFFGRPTHFVVITVKRSPNFFVACHHLKPSPWDPYHWLWL